MLKEKIQNLKKEKGAVILAHYYTSKDVQEEISGPYGRVLCQYFCRSKGADGCMLYID